MADDKGLNPFLQAMDVFAPPPRVPLPIEKDWRVWCPAVIPGMGTAPFAPHHAEFWDWVWALKLGVKPDVAFIAIWGRGGAKSSSAEGSCVAVGALELRRYCLYISGTQDQADDHVANIGELLGARTISRSYPRLGERKVDKFGNVKGWRRNRLWTASGYTVDALGLDTAVRGIKLEDARPDYIVLDDIDDQEDTVEAVDKKVRILTRRVLPAGSKDLAVVGVQNLVHSEGVFARMAGVASKPADFLQNRYVSGPVPAVRDLQWEQREGRIVITGGEATWAGQSLETCQAQIEEWGISAFLSEAQHDTEPPSGHYYDHITFARCKAEEVPWKDLHRVEVWVDPAVTDKDASDSNGIQIDGMTKRGQIFRLWSWEQRSTPDRTMRIAIRQALVYGATKVGVETNQGGDTWRPVYREAVRALIRERTGVTDVEFDERERAIVRARNDEAEELAWSMPVFDEVKATIGEGSKIGRQQKQVFWYEKLLKDVGPRFVHVEGSHIVLERALRRFGAKKPYDLADVSYWSAKSLIDGAAAAPVRAVVVEGPSQWQVS